MVKRGLGQSPMKLFPLKDTPQLAAGFFIWRTPAFGSESVFKPLVIVFCHSSRNIYFWMSVCYTENNFITGENP
jgi:hypothetical protein